MAQSPPPSTGAFNSLPIELNQIIAHYLESDKDIATFRQISRGARDAIDADNCSFWRVRFREKFDLKTGVTNKSLGKIYRRRIKYLRYGMSRNFSRGSKGRENAVIEVLRDLIVDSFQDGAVLDEHGRPRCKNQMFLQKFVLESKMLLDCRRDKELDSNPLLMAVKLMCSHFLFEIAGVRYDVFATELSQRIVYLPTNAAPIYTGPSLTDVNIGWVFHCLEFFRYHMTNLEVSRLCEIMRQFSPGQKPSAWQGPLRNGAQALGKHWKGTYAFLEPLEVRKLRGLSEDQLNRVFLADKNIDEGKIQSLELDFEEGKQKEWPPIFESRLHSLRNPTPTPTRAQGRGKLKDTHEEVEQKSVQFVGEGIDLDDDFRAIGWLNPLPDQHGIPGWQRITFMKHFEDDLDQVEQDNLWAYEGVVLPGGRIALGRWWYASDEVVDFDHDYNGPFILWAVDDPEEN